ncbi:MAG: sigma-70 family RNA polymerase sigma factor [Anaerolineae bacterium]
MAGDGAAFAALYERYVDRTYRYFYVRLGDAQLAADLCHDTWLQALAHIDRLRAPARFEPWLIVVARNVLLSQYRAAGARPVQLALDPIGMDGAEASGVGRGAGDATSARSAIDGQHVPAEAAADATADADALAARALRMKAVVAALRSLSPLQREVLALRYGAEQSVEETARLVRRSSTAVIKLQQRAIQQLRALVSAEEALE